MRGSDRLFEGCYEAPRAATLAGVPVSTVYDWARKQVVVPTVSLTKPKLWSWTCGRSMVAAIDRRWWSIDAARSWCGSPLNLPHIAHSRLTSQTVAALANRGFTMVDIRRLYPSENPDGLHEAVELEHRLAA